MFKNFVICFAYEKHFLGEQNYVHDVECYGNVEEPHAVCEVTAEFDREPEENFIRDFNSVGMYD